MSSKKTRFSRSKFKKTDKYLFFIFRFEIGKRMAVKLYIFVILRTIVPSWFWCLHDLVLSRLAELPSYVPKCYCLNSLQSEKIKNKLWPSLFGKRNRGSNIVLKIPLTTKRNCCYIRLEFEKWLAICDGVGDVILGDALSFKLFLKFSYKKNSVLFFRVSLNI